MALHQRKFASDPSISFAKNIMKLHEVDCFDSFISNSEFFVGSEGNMETTEIDLTANLP